MYQVHPSSACRSPALVATQELGARVKAIGTAKSDLVTTQETLEASLSAAVAKSDYVLRIHPIAIERLFDSEGS